MLTPEAALYALLLLALFVVYAIVLPLAVLGVW
jgi:hypothetical protein